MQVFVLNLARADERRTRMQARLDALGLKAEFFPAVEGRLLPSEVLEEGAQLGLSPGELGCYFSHLALWKEVLARGSEGALVLEDDTVLDPALPQVLNEIRSLPHAFDLVRLSSLNPVRGVTVARLKAGRQLVLPTKNPSGTQGYWVSRAGAARLGQILARPRLPIDDELDAYWQYGMCIPVLTRPVIREEDDAVSLIGARGGSTSKNEKNLRQHFARVVQAQRRKLAAFRMAWRLNRA
ncbi:glycosyltransferase family 25 protein [Zoogloea sp.]|uniref:glycosyltransferase family 25 protein n=1 Tax=Zoogloea sp. TaxID=49181 RepID=UPI0035B269C4|nr:glycosyltransferase family 25 protein [Rhodocyclales bacterium]